MKVLVFTTLYPNERMPLNAVFVRRRMEAWAQLPAREITVVAPVPWFPRLPFKTLASWDRYASVPELEHPWGYAIHHPRYVVTPKVGMRWYGQSMLAATRRLVSRLHAEHRFDLIDAHYVFPDGEAAVALGRELGIPVVVSSRGTDLNLYPQLASIRPRIQRTLEAADHVICVCSELGKVAAELGTPQSRLSIIGNGIDPGLFRPMDQAFARSKLGLPQSGTVLISVGHLTERKGFHLLIEALDGLARSESPSQPIPTLVIVGDGPQRPELEAQIERRGLQAQVRMVGARQQEELPIWYAAADLFLLASSREGWPNVLCEAQAMGLPAIATHAWGMGEILNEPALGLLVQERSASAFQSALSDALATHWDRAKIAEIGGRRTWPIVANDVDRVLSETVARRKLHA